MHESSWMWTDVLLTAQDGRVRRLYLSRLFPDAERSESKLEKGGRSVDTLSASDPVRQVVSIMILDRFRL